MDACYLPGRQICSDCRSVPEILEGCKAAFRYIRETALGLLGFVIPPSRYPPKPNRKGKAPDVGRNAPRPPRKDGPAAGSGGGGKPGAGGRPKGERE
jgi:hypothetical protein